MYTSICCRRRLRWCMFSFQDSRHAMASPTPPASTHQALQQRQSSINLPPLVKSPLIQRPSKLPKPSKNSVSHIPRPTDSSGGGGGESITPSKQSLPPINSYQNGQANGNVGAVWAGGSTAANTGPGQTVSKLPVSIKEKTGNKQMKSGIQIKTSKRDINYARYTCNVMYDALTSFMYMYIHILVPYISL